MVKIYVRRIKDKEMTLDEVPERWRLEVEIELKAQGII